MCLTSSLPNVQESYIGVGSKMPLQKRFLLPCILVCSVGATIQPQANKYIYAGTKDNFTSPLNMPPPKVLVKSCQNKPNNNEFVVKLEKAKRTCSLNREKSIRQRSTASTIQNVEKLCMESQRRICAEAVTQYEKICKDGEFAKWLQGCTNIHHGSDVTWSN